VAAVLPFRGERRAERREALRERIKRNVRVECVSGCWLWTGRANKGYGTLTVRLPGYDTPRPLYAHRVAYEVFKRRPPDGLHIAHSIRCVSPLCCNPDHLTAKTPSANMLDKRPAKRWRERNLREIWPPTHYLVAA
jgi:hypothetical protein